MDYKIFSREMDKEVKKMDRQDLYSFAMDLLRHVPEKRRDMILESTVHKESESSLSIIVVKKEYERVMELCEKISAGEKSIKGASCEYDEYNRYEYGYEDESVTYEDEDNIEEDLIDALEIANWMLLEKKYKYAEDIYDTVCTIVVSIEYDEDFCGHCDDQNEFTFDEFIDEMNSSINGHKVAIETLYAVYMNTDKTNRANRLYRHYAWESKFPIKLEQLLTIGHEQLKNFDDFLVDWVDLLVKKASKGQAELLEDAFIYLEGKESLEKYAKELPDRFPSFYLHWFEELFQNKEYEKIVEEAFGAFKAIERVSKERYLIANMVYISSKKLSNCEMMFSSTEAMFESKPCVKTFLRLRTLPLAEVLCKRITIPQIEITNLNLDEKEKKTIMVFNNQWSEIWAELSKNKKPVGWTYDVKGILVPIFLIMLVDVNKITPLMKYMLKGVVARLDYSMQLDDMEFIEYYKLWRNSVDFTEKDHSELYNWCKTEVTNRVREIVSNKYRNAYLRAAEASQLLSEVAFYIGKTNSEDEIALRHKAEFPRHRAFRAEYDNLPK